MATFGKLQLPSGDVLELTLDGWKTGDEERDQQMDVIFPRPATVVGNPVVKQFWSAADKLSKEWGAVVIEEPQPPPGPPNVIR